MSELRTYESYSSTANYLKKSPTLSGKATVAVSGATASYTVTHNLGYVPFWEVATDVTNNGTLWMDEDIDIYTETSLTGVNKTFPYIDSWSDTTTLTIYITNSTATTNWTIPISWAIYLDYGS